MATRFKPKFNIKKGDLVIVISGAAKTQKDENGKLLYKPRTVKDVLCRRKQSDSRRGEYCNPSYQTKCTEYKRWFGKEGSPDPYQQHHAVGCESKSPFESEENKGKRESGSCIKKIRRKNLILVRPPEAE